MFWCHWLRGAWTCLFLVHYYYYNYNYYYSVARWCHGGLGSVSTSITSSGSVCLLPTPPSQGLWPSSLMLLLSWKKIVYPGTLVGFVEFYVRCVCANVNKHVPEVWEHKKEPSCCLWTILTAFPLGSPIFKSNFFVSSVIFSPWALTWCLLSGD